MMKKNLYVDMIMPKMKEVVKLEQDKIDQAAKIIAKQVSSGGILQAFGSGHSYAAAIEICGRAGGLIPSKVIDEPSRGIYEMVEGVGEQFVKISDFQRNDVVVLISNSGRNPLAIEIADHVKKCGAKIIVLTALTESKKMTSRHSSGKKLYEFADVILDNHSCDGDAAIALSGLDVKTGGTSSLTGTILLNEVMLRAIQLMLEAGFNPPLFKSANVDGGAEYNEKLLEKYAKRLYHR
ncbi:MAG: SIS domain-containing protein [Mycoplasmatales bacterium]